MTVYAVNIEEKFEGVVYVEAPDADTAVREAEELWNSRDALYFSIECDAEVAGRPIKCSYWSGGEDGHWVDP